MKLKLAVLALGALAVTAFFVLRNQNGSGANANKVTDFNLFFDLHTTDEVLIEDTLDQVKQGWHPGSAIMLVEMFHLAKFHRTQALVAECLEEMTGEKFGRNAKKWQNWIWNNNYQPHPQYPQFQTKLYCHVDTRFEEYFKETDDALIRLDEIKWGGISQDKIPPLKDAPTIKASEAKYLRDSNEVFGVSINGDHRCYPKRILAWHEMFKDTIGGVPVCGVY